MPGADEVTSGFPFPFPFPFPFQFSFPFCRHARLVKCGVWSLLFDTIICLPFGPQTPVFMGQLTLLSWQRLISVRKFREREFS